MWGRPTPRVGRTWTASRPGALRGGVPVTPPNHLSYMSLPGTNVEEYKRGLILTLQGIHHSLIHHSPISHVREKE